MDEKGFSLTELMVGIVIGSIVLLMVGALSQVSFGSFNKLRAEAYVDDDAYFALDLIQHAVRKSALAPVTGSTLTADMKTFRVTSRVQSGATVYDLVYDDTSTTPATTNNKVINGVDGLTFATLPSPFTGNVVTVTLTVSKRIRASDSYLTVFNYSVKATRRNP